MLLIHHLYWDELYMYFYSPDGTLTVEIFRQQEKYNSPPMLSAIQDIERIRSLFASSIIHDDIEETTTEIEENEVLFV